MVLLACCSMWRSVLKLASLLGHISCWQEPPVMIHINLSFVGITKPCQWQAILFLFRANSNRSRVSLGSLWWMRGACWVLLLSTPSSFHGLQFLFLMCGFTDIIPGLCSGPESAYTWRRMEVPIRTSRRMEVWHAGTFHWKPLQRGIATSVFLKSKSDCRFRCQTIDPSH